MNRIIPSRRLDALMLAVACASLAACGGNDAPPPPPPPPATAPTITAQPTATVTVAEGATAALAVTAESNAGALSYQWRSGSTTPSTIAGATAASYPTPAASLLDDTKVFSVAVSNSVGTTTSGNATLSVTERSWSGLTLPRAAQGTSDTPMGNPSLSVAIDSLGATYMVFSEQRTNGSRALRISYTPAGQSSPQSTSWLGALNLPANVSEHDVKLVASDNGHVLAVWREGSLDDIGGVIKAALLQPGGGSRSGFAAISGGADAASPTAAYVGDGKFEIVWRQLASSEVTAYDIVARRLVFNSTVTNGQLLGIEAIEDESANALAPQIASDGAGNVLVAFSTNADFERSYANARNAAATAWTAANTQQFAGLYPVRLSSLTMNAQGRAVALMRGALTRVYMSQYQFAGNESAWSGEAQYVANHNPNLAPAVEPLAVFGAGNDFTIVSAHNGGAFLSVWPCQALACGEVQTFLNASRPNAITQLRAGRDAAGNLIVLFGLDMGSTFGVMASAMRFHAGLNVWRSMATAGTLGVDQVSGPLQLVVNPNGSAVALMPAAINDQTLARAWNFR